MSDMVELKPCPFCGGPAEIVDIDEGENAGGSCVCCTSCLASGNVEFEFKENFVSNWNRRATDPELSRLSALVAEWEKAAEPFARKFDIQDEWPDRTTLWIQNGDMIVAHAQVGDFRRLSQLKDTTNADK